MAAAETLRRVSMVVAEHPAESLATAHVPDGPWRERHGRDGRVAKSLVIPLGMVVSDVLANGVPEGVFAEEDHPVEAARSFVLARRDQDSAVRESHSMVDPVAECGPCSGLNRSRCYGHEHGSVAVGAPRLAPGDEAEGGGRAATPLLDGSSGASRRVAHDSARARRPWWGGAGAR